MKNKRFIKQGGRFVCILAASFLLSAQAFAGDAAPQIPQAEARPAAETVSIRPFADDIRWRYKTVNGKAYKRKYNYTTSQWVGNWIPA